MTKKKIVNPNGDIVTIKSKKEYNRLLKREKYSKVKKSKKKKSKK